MVEVSVIIPVYNRKTFCSQAIKMLRAQTLKDIEFIIVDDGSTDGTYELLHELIGKDDRFILLQQKKNLGPAVARNVALNAINGEYIGFFDIDDSIPVDYFEKMYSIAENNGKPEIVFCSYNGLKHDVMGSVNSLCDKISVLRNGALWDKLFSKDLIVQNAVSFPEGLYCADNVFVFKAFYYANRVLLTDNPVYEYKLAADSIGADKEKLTKRKKDILKVVDLLIDFMQKNKFNSDALNEASHFVNRSFNCYADDKVFKKALDKRIKSINIFYSALNKVGKPRENSMVWLRIKHCLGIINSSKFSELVLRERILKSGLFDKRFYLNQYSDVGQAKLDPVMHYLKHGWKEGRNPSSKFDNDAYLRDNPDVAAEGLCPLEHYINHGYKEGRAVHSVFVQRTEANDKGTFMDRLSYFFLYPIRVREEYERLSAELKDLKNRI